jgi:hypothetical protein
VLCKRLGRDSEIYPCEDFGHVLEYMMSSIEHGERSEVVTPWHMLLGVYSIRIKHTQGT